MVVLAVPATSSCSRDSAEDGLREEGVRGTGGTAVATAVLGADFLGHCALRVCVCFLSCLASAETYAHI